MTKKNNLYVFSIIWSGKPYIKYTIFIHDPDVGDFIGWNAYTNYKLEEKWQ